VRKNILVYTMGRAGSNFIASSILRKHSRVIATHSMSTSMALDGIKRNDKSSRIAREKKNSVLELLENNEELIIITAIRRPIDRALSSFRWFSNAFDVGHRATTSVLRNAFLTRFNHDWALEWFDREFREYLGFDLYQHKIKHKDYLVSGHKNLKFLILRTETLTQNLYKQLDELGVPNSPRGAVRHNNKKQTKAIRKKLRNVELPQWYVDKICGARFTQHCWPKEEIKKMRERWQVKL